MIQSLPHGSADAEITRPATTGRWVRPFCWSAALLLGGLHTWTAAAHHSMNPDGVAYLDIADAYLRGDWRAAVNTYWSPMYSWILAVATHLVRPSMRWEFPAVHLVNFSIYVLALICFERFWLRLGRERRTNLTPGTVTLPDPLWLALGYALFVYTALNLIRVWSVTPDMLVAALVYLAATLLMQARAGAATWRTFACLGVVLALGYLAKAAMLPLAVAFLGVALLSRGRGSRCTRFGTIAVAALLFIAGPYIGALSAKKGSLTVGDTGRLMYAWHINAVPHPHWQGEVPDAGTPTHGSRRIFESPAIYDFPRAAGGTYPIAYDPAYWYEGVKPHFEWRGQLRVLAISLQYYFDVFVRQQAGLIVGIAVLYYLGAARVAPGPRHMAQDWGLAAVAIVALGMYAVVHVQGRYIGAFVVLLWGDLLANVRLPASEQSRKLLVFAGSLMLAIVVTNILAFNLERGGRIAAGGPANTGAARPPAEPRWPGEVTQELFRVGLHPGDGVAVIGYGFDSYWARLGRMQIVAEMFDWEAEPFWAGDPSFQERVLRAFARTGAKAVVAERVPSYVEPAGWHRVGTSSYYIYALTNRPAAASESGSPAGQLPARRGIL